MVNKDDKEFARRCQCQSEDNHLRRAERANIPPRFRGATLEWSFQQAAKAPSLVKAGKAAEKFIKEYPALDKGLLFQGSTGVGKTSLLCAIGYELIKKNFDVYYIDWNDLVREMRTGEGHGTRDFSAIHQLINTLSEVDLLLFDELGASKVSQWVYDNIYYLFNRRYNNQKLTICASNFGDLPAEGNETLGQRIGERIRSRLFEMTQVMEMKGTDVRRES